MFLFIIINKLVHGHLMSITFYHVCVGVCSCACAFSSLARDVFMKHCDSMLPNYGKWHWLTHFYQQIGRENCIVVWLVCHSIPVKYWLNVLDLLMLVRTDWTSLSTIWKLFIFICVHMLLTNLWTNQLVITDLQGFAQNHSVFITL